MAPSSKKSQVPQIGFLHSQQRDPFAKQIRAFERGLKEVGFNPGKQVTITYRFAKGDPRLLKQYAEELAASPVKMIVTAGGTGAALAAKRATGGGADVTPLPIVFVEGRDPVKAGLVDSIDSKGRPTGHATGVHVSTTELLEDRFALLNEMVPAARKIAGLLNLDTVVADTEKTILGEAAIRARVDLQIVGASSKKGLRQAFDEAASAGAQALIVSGDPFFMIEHAHITALAARFKLPASYPWHAYSDANGLMSYGPDLDNAYRQIGVYAALVLQGTLPSELAILKPETIELVINLKAAKRLELRVPGALLARADHVID